MFLLLLQASPGLDPLVVSLAGFIGTALLAAIAALWRQAVAESRRKDELIDRLLEAERKNADANKRSVSLLAEERRRTPR